MTGAAVPRLVRVADGDGRPEDAAVVATLHEAKACAPRAGRRRSWRVASSASTRRSWRRARDDAPHEEERRAAERPVADLRALEPCATRRRAHARRCDLLMRSCARSTRIAAPGRAVRAERLADRSARLAIGGEFSDASGWRLGLPPCRQGSGPRGRGDCGTGCGGADGSPSACCGCGTSGLDSGAGGPARARRYAPLRHGWREPGRRGAVSRGGGPVTGLDRTAARFGAAGSRWSAGVRHGGSTVIPRRRSASAG